MSMLAMHMANELLSLPMAIITIALAALAVAVAAWASGRSEPGHGLSASATEKLPLMGVMGAFVFAAQMINFTLPGLGTSGHLGGAVLLAILLGPARAIVTMTAILVIQCLLFQDGGLLAIGCNIINMGVAPALLGYGIYRLVLGNAAAAGAGRQYLAAWLASVCGVTAGAALVPLEAVGGPLAVPTLDFLLVMLGFHVLIGLVEGLITFAVLAYLRKARPAVLGLPATAAGTKMRLSRPALAASILVTALLLAGAVSALASEHPDGLECAVAMFAQKPPAAVAAPSSDAGAKADAACAPMPDYNWKVGWFSIAGVIGTAVTLGVVVVAGRALSGSRGRRARGGETASRVDASGPAPAARS